MDCSQLTRSSFLVSWYGLGGQIPRHGLGIGSSHRRYSQQGYNVSTLETAGVIPSPREISCHTSLLVEPGAVGRG